MDNFEGAESEIWRNSRLPFRTLRLELHVFSPKRECGILLGEQVLRPFGQPPSVAR